MFFVLFWNKKNMAIWFDDARRDCNDDEYGRMMILLLLSNRD